MHVLHVYMYILVASVGGGNEVATGSSVTCPFSICSAALVEVPIPYASGNGEEDVDLDEAGDIHMYVHNKMEYYFEPTN